MCYTVSFEHSHSNPARFKLLLYVPTVNSTCCNVLNIRGHWFQSCVYSMGTRRHIASICSMLKCKLILCVIASQESNWHVESKRADT